MKRIELQAFCDSGTKLCSRPLWVIDACIRSSNLFLLTLFILDSAWSSREGCCASTGQHAPKSLVPRACTDRKDAAGWRTESASPRPQTRGRRTARRRATKPLQRKGRRVGKMPKMKRPTKGSSQNSPQVISLCHCLQFRGFLLVPPWRRRFTCRLCHICKGISLLRRLLTSSRQVMRPRLAPHRNPSTGNIHNTLLMDL